MPSSAPAAVRHRSSAALGAPREAGGGDRGERGVEHAGRWHATQAWQTAAGVLARSQVFARLAARAGIGYTTGGRAPSSDWSSGSPSFSLLPGESAAGALERLVAVVSDGVRSDGDAFVLTGCGTGDAPDYAYGPGEHSLASLTLLDEGPRTNWARVQGLTATRSLRRGQRRRPRAAAPADPEPGRHHRRKGDSDGRRRAAPGAVGHAGGPPRSAVQRRSATLRRGDRHERGARLDERDFRVIGCGWEYDRGGGREPRLDSILDLGGL
jgi:hypothetical protein